MRNSAIEVGNKVARTVDAFIQDELDSDTDVIYGGSQTARANITASDTMTASKLAEAFARLNANDAKKFGGYYVAVMHPLVAHDLRVESGTGVWLDVNKYTNNVDKIFKGEVGALHGCRVVESSNVREYTDGGSGTVDVYPTYVLGQDTFGFVQDLALTKTSIQMPGSAGADDPLAQYGTIGMKVRVGCEILKTEGLYRIETASSLGAN